MTLRVLFRILWFLLGAIFLLSVILTATGAAATIEYTLPAYDAKVEFAGTDSAGISCDISVTPLVDLETAVLHGYPLTGGGWRVIREKDVRGRAGEQDTMQVDTGWNYFITTKDTSGNESCASPTVSIPGTVTGVPVDPYLGKVKVREAYFSVTGRMEEARRPFASGVYWLVTWYLDRSVKVEKIIIIK